MNPRRVITCIIGVLLLSLGTLASGVLAASIPAPSPLPLPDPHRSLQDTASYLSWVAPKKLGKSYGCLLPENQTGGRLSAVHLLVSSHAALRPARQLAATTGHAKQVKVELTPRRYDNRSMLRVFYAARAARLGPGAINADTTDPSFHRCPGYRIVVSATDTAAIARARAIEARYGADRARVQIVAPGTPTPD